MAQGRLQVVVDYEDTVNFRHNMAAAQTTIIVETHPRPEQAQARPNPNREGRWVQNPTPNQRAV